MATRPGEFLFPVAGVHMDLTDMLVMCPDSEGRTRSDHHATESLTSSASVEEGNGERSPTILSPTLVGKAARSSSRCFLTDPV